MFHKIDHMSRSVPDFALMLNILLSFGKCQPEVPAECIRDKLAASRRMGVWMDGVPLRGDRVDHCKLVADEERAGEVRWRGSEVAPAWPRRLSQIEREVQRRRLLSRKERDRGSQSFFPRFESEAACKSLCGPDATRLPKRRKQRR